MGSTLVVTGLLARYLDAREFGFWAVLFSLFNVLQFLDFGGGMALRNHIAQRIATGGGASSASGLFMDVIQLYGLASLLLAFPLTLVAYYFSPPWEVARQASMIVVLTAIFNIPLTMVVSCCYCYLETAWNALFDSCIGLVRAVAIMVGAAMGFTLSGLALVYYLPVLMIGLLALAAFLVRRDWKPRLSSINSMRDSAIDLGRTAAGFAVLQASSLVMSNADTLIVAQVANQEQAGEYFVVQRLFFLLITVHMVLIQSYWSAYTIKYLRKEFQWIRKAMSQGLLLMLVLHLSLSTFLWTYGQSIIFLWTGKEIDISGLTPALCIWSLATATANHYSVFLNAIFQTRFQSVVVLCGVLLGMPLAFFLGQDFGPPGVAWAAAAVAVPIAWMFRTKANYILAGNSD